METTIVLQGIYRACRLEVKCIHTHASCHLGISVKFPCISLVVWQDPQVGAAKLHVHKNPKPHSTHRCVTVDTEAFA